MHSFAQKRFILKSFFAKIAIWKEPHFKMMAIKF